MCGIVGYIGKEEAAPILLDGLEKLEYRGYDSAGIAVYNGTDIKITKTKGRLKFLAEATNEGLSMPGTLGIGHTRWATHGAPSDINSHPHANESGTIAVVHNGIIENYLFLKDYLMKKGYNFVSDTDTEVVAHLLDHYVKKYGEILEAVVHLMNRVEGSYALGIIVKENPDEIIAVRKDSPLIVGLSPEGNFIASDIPAILKYTRDIYLLEDREIVRLSRDGVTVYDVFKEPIKKEITHIDWDITAAEKGGYEHFMFKEILEQPKALKDTISPRIHNGEVVIEEMKMTDEEIKNLKKIYIVACGSAYHAGAVGKYVIEDMARIPVEIDIASEFRYRNPIFEKDSLAIIISQSGETADTLAALREAKKNGVKTLAIVNVVGSSIARDADNVLYTWAGPEIAVATTKAYSTQVSALYLIGLLFAKKRGTIEDSLYKETVKELVSLPDKVASLLKDFDKIQNFAAKKQNAKDIFFLGRGVDYATALEGSLKLKEISYIHSEAYAAGELKHGTISLIEEGTLVVSLATQENLFNKMLSNIKEVRTRGAVIMAIALEGNTEIEKEADFVLYVPKVLGNLAPSLSVIPLQLFSYYIAVGKGCDVDKPRNLAKSVTVE
jgi:glucosamine--fructose-6-phosphate aminotransferase (isomerizing)